VDRTQVPTRVANGLLKAAECIDVERPSPVNKVEVAFVVVAEMPYVPVTRRMNTYREPDPQFTLSSSDGRQKQMMA
jgi:hypothetical protein